MSEYNKKVMGTQAAELGFIRDAFEKTSRLVDILAFFERDPILSQYLALKGGTAINMTVLCLPRLSVDIDLDFSKMENLTFKDIRMKLIPMLRKQERFDLTVAKERVGEYLSKNLVLSADDKKFLLAFTSGEYRPELLFDGEELIRVANHPMAIWKMQNHQ